MVKNKVFGPCEGGKIVSKSFLNVQQFFFHSPRIKPKDKIYVIKKGEKSILFIFSFSFFTPLYLQTADIFNFHPVSLQCTLLASALLTLYTPVLLLELAEST